VPKNKSKFFFFKCKRTIEHSKKQKIINGDITHYTRTLSFFIAYHQLLSFIQSSFFHMVMMRIVLFTTALLLSSTSSQVAAASFPSFVGRFAKDDDTDCKTIETVQNFDIDKYIEFTWYIQRQQVNSYQSAESLYCVTATYNDDGKKQWGKPAISVSNYNNDGMVNAPTKDGSDGVICATTSIANEPAKLAVAPCFLPPFLAGDYWVAAVADDYSWAIVTGGQPTIAGECVVDALLCTTPETSALLGNGQGLWFFMREQAQNAVTLATMEATALALGICTANMVDVVHEGCTYAGANHKIREYNIATCK
jgi:lipocalin